MSHRHLYWHTDGREKSTKELLADLIWQGAVQVYFLKVIAEGLTDVATTEQVAALTAAIDEFEAAEDAELGAINAKIDALIAQAGDTPDPNLDAQIERLTALRNKLAGTVEGGAEPDAPPTP